MSVHTSVAQLASTSSSVSFLYPIVFATMNWTSNMNKSYMITRLPQFPVFGQCPPPEARPCQITGTVYLEKRTILPGFRKATLAGNILRKIALQERGTKETISVAAIFSRRCSRVEKTQAFEDGLTASKNGFCPQKKCDVQF